MDFVELRPRFWDPETRLETFPDLRTQDVERAEAVLGVRLPPDYISLLEVQNGGYIAGEFDAAPTTVPTSWADDHVQLRTLAGIGTHDS